MKGWRDATKGSLDGMVWEHHCLLYGKEFGSKAFALGANKDGYRGSAASTSSSDVFGTPPLPDDDDGIHRIAPREENKINNALCIFRAASIRHMLPSRTQGDYRTGQEGFDSSTQWKLG
jgi:hypothetical protein